jgi:hypothetical protein
MDSASVNAPSAYPSFVANVTNASVDMTIEMNKKNNSNNLMRRETSSEKVNKTSKKEKKHPYITKVLSLKTCRQISN